MESGPCVVLGHFFLWVAFRHVWICAPEKRRNWQRGKAALSAADGYLDLDTSGSRAIAGDPGDQQRALEKESFLVFR